MHKTALLTGMTLLMLSNAYPAGAQDDGVPLGVQHDQVFSASPILLMFKWLNVDYERRVSPAVTLGASGSYWPTRGFDYARATFHARFYPRRAALTGFYFGGQAGVHRSGSRADHPPLFGAGMDVGYAWLLGADRNVAVSLGYGLTRLRGGDPRVEAFAIPNVRLINVGFAF